MKKPIIEAPVQSITQWAHADTNGRIITDCRGDFSGYKRKADAETDLRRIQEYLPQAERVIYVEIREVRRAR